MGNDHSQLWRLKRLAKGKSTSVVICSNNIEPPPAKPTQNVRKTSRTTTQSRAPSRQSLPVISSPTSATLGVQRTLSTREANTKSNQFLLPSPQPGADRRRSRSLNGQQIQQDAATLSVKEEAPQRKNSTSMIQSLTRLRIQQSFKAARSTIGEAILRRAGAARSDVRLFLSHLPEETMTELSQDLFVLLSVAVESVEKSEKMIATAENLGESFADLVNAGFRPEFFSALADAAIAECGRLDGGTHKRCDTLIAWSQLVTTIFSSVRDGYYSRIRFQRRASLPHNRLERQKSVNYGNSKSVDDYEPQEEVEEEEAEYDEEELR